MGTRLFEKSPNLNLQVLNKETLKAMNKTELTKWSLVLDALRNEKIKTNNAGDRFALFKNLNKLRYWTASHIMLNKRILAYLLFGDANIVKYFLKDAFKLGIYLPRKQLYILFNKYFNELRNIYISNPNPIDILDLFIENFYFDPFFEREITKETIQKERIVTKHDEILNTKKNSIIITDKNIKQYKKDKKIKTNKRPAFITYPGTTKQIVNEEIFDLRVKTREFIIEAYEKSKYKFIETIKDSIVSVAFNWIKLPGQNTKGFEDFADFVITDADPPPNVNYTKIPISRFRLFIYNGIKLCSNNKITLNTIINENLRFEFDRKLNNYVLTVPNYWKRTYNSDFRFEKFLVPDIRVNRLIAKTKRRLQFKKSIKLELFVNDINTNK